MNPERWRQISQLYGAVLAQDTTGRATFLADACGADDELRETLESLLAHQDSAEHFLDVPALEVTARSDSEAAPTTPMEGRRFGAYRIQHEIGRGGMGSVYLADRVDETFHKRVAIKIVRPGFVDAEIIGRFRQEREILAALDHPTIARVIDGGSTDDGVPYFVMDYVDGQPIGHGMPISRSLGWSQTSETEACWNPRRHGRDWQTGSNQCRNPSRTNSRSR